MRAFSQVKATKMGIKATYRYQALLLKSTISNVESEYCSHGQLFWPFGPHRHGIVNKQAQSPTEDNDNCERIILVKCALNGKYQV